jgi:LmbE family N-acetylglucosaminyl deacetylase
MPTLKLTPRGCALVIVAHPDDETIWMGGTILNNPKINWTIFSLCRRHDADRYPKFLKVCRFYGATGAISDLEDEGIMDVEDSLAEIKKRIIKVIRNKKFDYVFSHGSNGEYGHPRHCGANLVINQLIKTKKIKAKEFYAFSYLGRGTDKACRPNFKAPYRTKLSAKIFKTKKEIINKLYGFNPGSFEYKSCAIIEPFDRIK